MRCLVGISIAILFGLSLATQTISAGDLKKPVLSKEIQEDLKVLRSELGPPILRHNAPALYKLVGQVFDRVANVVEKRLEKSHVTVANVFIVDSSHVNAFVFAPRTVGVHVSEQLVFVTTGMLRKLFFNGVKFDFDGGSKMLAGILAHEMGHPLDKLVESHRHGESLSIDLEYGERSRQAQEIRADVDGSILLREANLPEDGLYQSSLRVLELDQRVSVVESAFQTHPSGNLRTTGLRLYLTVSRLRQGLNWEESPLKVSQFDLDGIQVELEKFRLGLGRFPWSPISDLSSGIDRLRRFLAVPESFRQLEFNRLILAIDDKIRELEGAKKNVPSADLQALGEALLFLAKKEELNAPWNANERVEMLQEYPDSVGFMQLPLHQVALNSLKAYRHPKYLEAIEKIAQHYLSLKNKSGHTRYGHGKISILAQLMPRKEFLERFAHEWLADELAGMHDPTNRFYGDTIPKFSDPRLGLTLLPDMVEKWASWDSTNSLVVSFIESWSKSYDLPYFVGSDWEEVYRQTLSRMAMEAKGGNIESQRILTMTKKQAEKIWAYRGQFAILELIARSYGDSATIEAKHINWAFIADLSGVSKDQVANQVRQEVERLVSDEKAFRHLMSVLGRASLVEESVTSAGFRQYKNVNRERTGDSQENDHFPIWYRPQLGRQMISLAGVPPDNQNLNHGFFILRRAVLAQDTPLREECFRVQAEEYFSQYGNLLKQKNVGEVLALVDQRFRDRSWLKADGNKEPLSLLALGESIARSKSLKARQKKMAIKFLFARDGQTEEEQSEALAPEYYWWTSFEEDKLARVLNLLLEQGIYSSLPDLVESLKNSPHYSPIQNVRLQEAEERDGLEGLGEYFAFIDRIAPRLIGEIESGEFTGLEELHKYASLLNTPQRLEVDRAKSNTASIQDFRNSIAIQAQKVIRKSARTKGEKIAKREIVALFLEMTATGPSKATDEFFEKLLLPTLNKKGGINLEWIRGILLTSRLQSPHLRLMLTQKVSEPQWVEAERNSLNKHELWAAIADLNKMAPGGSLAKDDYLESIGIRLRLRGAPLFAFVEDQKTSNWRRENPFLVNAGSMIVDGIVKLTFAKRRAFLAYLIDPAGHPGGLPEEVVQEFFQTAYNEIMGRFEDGRRKSVFEASALARRASKLLKLEVEHYLRDSAPKERIPLIEATLTAGYSSFVRQADYPYNVIREFLKYEEGSFAESGLIEYLGLIQELERAPTLAYLLSQSGAEKGAVADIFTLFGVPGKKFGQFSSIFEIFGPKVAAETKHLKNHAPPLTLHQMYTELDKLLPADLSGRIQIQKILGSASVKTVAFAQDQLHPEVRIAIHMRDPHIENQNRTHLDMGKRFMGRMVDKGLVQSTRMLGALLDSMDEMLLEEIDFEIEGRRGQVLAQILDDYTKQNQAQLQGWSFSTPKLLEGYPLLRQLAFYQAVEGVPFDELDPATQKELGPQLVKLSLGMLFRYRHFDPDRHLGNWLIDVKTKQIHFLDAGQLTDFMKTDVSDPMEAVFEFLLGIRAQDSSAIYQSMLKMLQPGAPHPAFSSQLKSDIEKSLFNPKLNDVIVGLLTAFVEAEFKLDRKFIFGLGKGVVTLFGENYVSSDQFMQILSEEAQAGYMKKFLGGLPNPVFAPCEDLLTARLVVGQ